MIALEQHNSSTGIAEPISTIVNHSIASDTMTVRLSADTQIEFGGDRFVHGASNHQIDLAI